MNQALTQGAVIYCRVSTAEQTEGFSLSLQERLCKEYCRNHGYEVHGVFVDEGKSARTLDRPEFLKAIAFCHNKRESIGYFIVYRLDRFSRSQVDHYTIKASLRKIGVRLVSATQEVNEEQPESILIEGIAAAVGEYESRIIGLRAKMGMEEARRNGRLSNIAPIGYLNTRVKGIGNTVIPDERMAPYVQEAFSLYASGGFDKYEIVQMLNSKGYISPRGKQLSQQQLKKILSNRTYTGHVRINKTEGWTKGMFPPLITEDLFNLVQERVLKEKTPQSKPYSKKRELFPLRGFLLCGKCNNPLTASLSRGKSGKRYGYYRCFKKSCSGVNVRKEHLEEEFISFLDTLSPSKSFLGAAHKADSLRKVNSANTLIELMQRKDTINSRRQKLIDLYLDEMIQHDVYKERYDLIQKDLSNLADEIRNLTDEEFIFDNLLDQATSRLEKAAYLWANGNMKSRSVFQMSLFPGGLTYDSIHKFGTPLTTRGFNYLQLLKMDKKQMAGEQGVEPRLADPETAVLPLDDSPASTNYHKFIMFCQVLCAEKELK